MTDKATFSTHELPRYRVDGQFLADLQELMLRHAATLAHPTEVYTSIEISTKMGAGTRVSKDSSPRILLDGRIPHPESVEICVGGASYEDGEHVGFHYCARFGGAKGGSVYAAGPAEAAQAVHDHMLRAISLRSIEPEPARPTRIGAVADRLVPIAESWHLFTASLVLSALGMVLSVRGSAWFMLLNVAGLLALLVWPTVRLLRTREPVRPDSVVDLSRPTRVPSSIEGEPCPA